MCSSDGGGKRGEFVKSIRPIATILLPTYLFHLHSFVEFAPSPMLAVSHFLRLTSFAGHELLMGRSFKRKQMEGDTSGRPVLCLKVFYYLRRR